jgi:hypothetical protein
MARLVLGCLFLRDTFSHPSCTLVQPSMRFPGPSISPPVPSFASDKLWPRIYPLETELMAKTEASPMLCMYSAQMAPAPAPPTLASQTVVQCQPLKVILETLLIVSSKSARRNMEMLRAFLVVNGCGSFAFNTGQVISPTFYF